MRICDCIEVACTNSITVDVQKSLYSMRSDNVNTAFTSIKFYCGAIFFAETDFRKPQLAKKIEVLFQWKLFGTHLHLIYSPLIQIYIIVYLSLVW